MQTENTCEVCVCRHLTRSVLECRLGPPRQDVGQFAIYPIVRPDMYCIGGFRPDEAAIAARAERREIIRAAAAPLVGDLADPPQGDLLADIAQPRAIARDLATGEVVRGEGEPAKGDMPDVPLPSAGDEPTVTGVGRARRARPEPDSAA